MVGVFEKLGQQVGTRAIQTLCQRCGNGLESHAVAPCATDEERDKALRAIIADLTGDKLKLAKFLDSLRYSSDPNLARLSVVSYS